MCTRKMIGLMLAAVVAGTAGAVEPELAAENVITEINNNVFIGGAASQRLAQVFELRDTGHLSHLMLPVACDPQAVLRVSIEEAPAGIPSGYVVAQQDVPGYVLDAMQWGQTVAAMRMVEFTKPAQLKPGLYAFTLVRKGKGDCAIWRAPAGAPYSHYAYNIANGNAPGWQLLLDGVGNPQFLAFQVFQRPH